MNIWVFQTGEPLPLDQGDVRPMRAINLCNELIRKGHRVKLWSADFNHQTKQFRGQAGQDIRIGDDLEIVLIPSAGYQKNIGLGRLADHAGLAKNLKRLLAEETEVPNVAFVGYPPIETAYVFSRWLKRKNVPFLLDVKDQWPNIFVNALPRFLQPIGPVLLWPYFHCARQSMRSASGISAMAEGFLDWAVKLAGRARSEHDQVFSLSTPTEQVSEEELHQASQWWQEFGVCNDGLPRLYFVGSFSPAFDFVPIYRAAQLAIERGDRWQFVLCGDGAVAAEVRSMMSDLPNVIFPGWIDRPKIESLSKCCIASIAPYRNTPDFMLSIPNKIIDSLALGLPVLSPLKGEVESLIQAHAVGLAYQAEAGVGVNSLCHAIERLIEDKKLQNSMSSNARELYNARFSFERVYGSLVTHLEQLAV